MRIIGDRVVLTRGEDGQWTRSGRDAVALSLGGAGTAARPGSLGVGIGVGSAGGPLDVTALLDAEQFAAISAPPEEALLVLGSAGSGKTTVALHRLAHIAAREPKNYPLARMGVVVPEEGLARLSRRLLQPLGVGKAQVKTLDAWSHDLARQVFSDPIPRICMDAPALVSGLKRHPALYDALCERFGGIKPENTSLKRLRRRLADAFTDRSFLRRRDGVGGGLLPRGGVEDGATHHAAACRVGREALRHHRPGNETRGRRPCRLGGHAGRARGARSTSRTCRSCFPSSVERGARGFSAAHLVLDEAEDFALFELFVLGKLLEDTRSVTLAGTKLSRHLRASRGGRDRSRPWGRARPNLPTRRFVPMPEAGGRPRTRGILGHLAPAAERRLARRRAGRTFEFPSEQQAELFVADPVRDLIQREPRHSLAVLCNDTETARRCYELIRELPEARLVLHGDFSFDPGIDVTDVDNAKGLEFDYVIVPDASVETYPMTDDARRRLHVAVTRTSHQLWLVSGGTPSPLLGDVRHDEQLAKQ